MSIYEDDVRRFSARVRAAMVLRHLITLAVAWIFAWGICALVLRVAASARPSVLLWGFAGLIPIPFLAAFLARKAAPQGHSVRAALDKGNNLGGMLMAGGEQEIGLWRQQLQAPTVPCVRWHGRKWWILLAASIVFVTVVLVVPAELVGLGPAAGLDIDREVEHLTQQIETLQEENVVEPEKADELREKLEQTRANALGEDPAKTWEALDHIQEQAARIAQEAAEKSLNQTGKLAKAEMLSKALQEGAGKLSPEQAADAMKALSEMVKNAAADSQLAEKMSKALGESCENGTLSQEQLKELSEALSQCKGEVGEMLEGLCKAGLIDPAALELCKKLGQCDPQGLIDFLNENQGEACISDLVSLCKGGGRPGRGGITRGRGDAAMTWTDGSDPTGAKFKEQALPPASLEALKESQLTGVSVGDPASSDGPEATRAGALAGAASGGGSAHTHTILPRHRRAVRKYFERGAK